MTARSISRETKRWLAYAQQDINVAQELLAADNNYTNAVCYHAQQAAEKALKAGLIFAQIDFPFVHDLTVLKNLLPIDWQTRQDAINLNTLTSWATASRYPGITPEPTEADARQAQQQAERVIGLIQMDISQHGLNLI